MSQMPSQVNSPNVFSETGSFALRNLSDYAQLRAQNELAKAQLNFEKTKLDSMKEQFQQEMGQRQNEQASALAENEKNRQFQAQQMQQGQQFEAGQNELNRRIQEQQLKQQDEQFIATQKAELDRISLEADRAITLATSQNEIDAINEDANRKKEVVMSRLAAARLSLQNNEGRLTENKTSIVDTVTAMDKSRADVTDQLTSPLIKSIQQAVLLDALESSKKEAERPQELYGPEARRGRMVIQKPDGTQEVVGGSTSNLTSRVASSVASKVAGVQGFEGVKDQIRDFVYTSLQLSESPDDPTAKKAAEGALEALLKTGRVDAYQAREIMRTVAGSLAFSEESATDMAMTQAMEDLNKSLLDEGMTWLQFGRSPEQFRREFLNSRVKELNEKSERVKRTANSLFSNREIMEPGTLSAVFVSGLTDGNPDNDGPILEKLDKFRRMPGGAAFLAKVQEATGRINQAAGEILKERYNISSLEDEMKKSSESVMSQIGDINRRTATQVRDLTKRGTEQTKKTVSERGAK